MAIKFYKVNNEYGCFSNFSLHGFELDGKYWSTSEHYFQAQKFEDEVLRERIRCAKKPMEAALLGRNKALPLREDWEDIKEEVMRKALYAKFMANDDIKVVLMSTYPQEIIEDTSTDYYWGCGSDGTGLNRLGQLLIELRQQLL